MGSPACCPGAQSPLSLPQGRHPDHRWVRVGKGRTSESRLYFYIFGIWDHYPSEGLIGIHKTRGQESPKQWQHPLPFAPGLTLVKLLPPPHSSESKLSQDTNLEMCRQGETPQSPATTSARSHPSSWLEGGIPSQSVSWGHLPGQDRTQGTWLSSMRSARTS